VHVASISTRHKMVTIRRGRRLRCSSYVRTGFAWLMTGLLTFWGAASVLASSPPVADLTHTTPDISAEDLRRHITRLASDEMAGRLTGTAGEQRATDYVAAVFQALGLQPAGEHGTFFQPFDFTAGVSLGPGNRLTVSQGDAPTASEKTYISDREWRPLAFSKSGLFDSAEVVFAGYGLVAPAAEGVDAYDAFASLDVADKWVMVLRYVPERIAPEVRQHLAPYSHLRYKAMLARDHGARGLIVVSGPNAQVRENLVELTFDTSLAGTSIAALSITDEIADTWLTSAGHSLKTLQDELDAGQPRAGFLIPGVRIAATIDIRQEKHVGRNVLARLQASEPAGESLVIIGAHVDHLGYGLGTNSLARGEEKGLIHYGADDNASGVAGVLEIAQWLVQQKVEGHLPLRRDVLFAAWSGEELGLLGSSFFTRTFGSTAAVEPAQLTPAVAAYLNMDMIGRFEKALIVQGVGSSSIWAEEIARANAAIGLSITLQHESYLPTDATAFYLKGVPILNAFTGAHADYHTPRDTADKISYAGAEQVVRLMAYLTGSLATAAGAPDYRVISRPEPAVRRANVRVYLGTIPDYARSDLPGLKVAGVAQGGPAEQAGLQGGDVIVELAGKTVESIYDYTYALGAMQVGVPVVLVVLRGQERLLLTVTPRSRE
jgi:hypothetical protein